jgi:hypothetical protein
MSILVTGKGTSGSWVIRGQQLGAAVGATVIKNADQKTMSQFDVVIAVKRVSDFMLADLASSGTPWIWDVVDAWPQPDGNAWSRQRAVEWLRMEIRRLRPDGIIFPTTRMMEDADFVGPCMVLPHHANPKYVTMANIIREDVKTVGYEGAPHYLGKWRAAIDRECSVRGWHFIINGDLEECDIGVALRDVEGYPSPSWKSNVKLANLQALGIPAICSPEAGYVQFSSGTEQWVDDEKTLRSAFNVFSSYDYRLSVRQRMQDSIITIGRVREELLSWLALSKFC